MPEVKKTYQTLARFEAGPFEIREDADGDIRVGADSSGFYLSDDDDKANFAALIRAYLAHIDAAETPEPERDGVARVGDVIEILEDRADGTDAKKGDMFVVVDTASDLVKTRKRSTDGTWVFRPECYRIVRRASNTEAANA